MKRIWLLAQTNGTEESFRLGEQPGCISLMVELKQATIYIFCKRSHTIAFMHIYRRHSLALRSAVCAAPL